MMKHIFYFSIVLLLFSCNKEKQKTKWEIIPVMDKAANLSDYEITDLFINLNGEAFFMMKEHIGTTQTGIYHASNSDDSWTRLIGDESFTGHEFTSFSQVDQKLFLMSFSEADLTHTLFSYDLNSGLTTKKQLPGLVDDVLEGIHPQIDFLDETTGFLGFRGIWKTIDTGNVWSREYPFGTAILFLQFTDNNEAFAINKEHCIHTNDQWENWDTLFSSYGADFKKVQMANSTTGIILGRELWLTRDSGKNWDVILAETMKDASINEKGEIYVISQDNGIVRSINYGETWSKRTDKKEDFTCVFSSENQTLAGLKNHFKSPSEPEKEGVIIGRLKN